MWVLFVLFIKYNIYYLIYLIYLYYIAKNNNLNLEVLKIITNNKVRKLELQIERMEKIENSLFVIIN